MKYLRGINEPDTFKGEEQEKMRRRTGKRKKKEKQSPKKVERVNELMNE